MRQRNVARTNPETSSLGKSDCFLVFSRGWALEQLWAKPQHCSSQVEVVRMNPPVESYGTERHDRPYPSGQRSSGRASTAKACFGICSLVRNFCRRAPLGGPHWLVMSPGNLCVGLIVFATARFGSTSTSRTLTDRILPASWRTGQMMKVKCQGA